MENNEATIYSLCKQIKVSEELNKKREEMIKIQKEIISNLEMQLANSEIRNQAKDLEIIMLKEKNRNFENLILNYEKINEEMSNSLDNIIKDAANEREE